MKKEYFFVTITGFLFGFIIFSAQIFSNLGLSLFEISFFPAIIMSIFLAPFILFNKKLRPNKNIKFSLWIFYGFCGAAILLFQYGGVILGLPISIVLLLLYTQPLWTVIFSKIFLKENINKRKIFSCILIVAGLFILFNPFNKKIDNLVAIILALSAGLTLSAWILIGGIISKKNNNPVVITFIDSFLSVIFLLIFLPLLINLAPNMATFSFNHSFKIWVYLILFALIAGILSKLFYYIGVKKIPVSDAGIILLLEPIVGSLLATIFLNQEITFNIIMGGILILLANYMVISKK